MATNVILSDKQIEKLAKQVKIGTRMIGLGFLFSGATLFFFIPEYFAIGIPVIGFGVLLIVRSQSDAKFRQRLTNQRDEQLARQKAEQKRMADLQKTMTPGEWQTYLLQLDNNRLLDEIARKSKQNPVGPGVRPVFGVTRDVSETDD
jgi:hypothetical protein